LSGGVEYTQEGSEESSSEPVSKMEDEDSIEETLRRRRNRRDRDADEDALTEEEQGDRESSEVVTNYAKIFLIGTTVWKAFEVEPFWFRGVVRGHNDREDGLFLLHIEYDDGDEEEMTVAEFESWREVYQIYQVDQQEKNSPDANRRSER